jgi:hypothetical protein
LVGKFFTDEQACRDGLLRKKTTAAARQPKQTDRARANFEVSYEPDQ